MAKDTSKTLQAFKKRRQEKTVVVWDVKEQAARPGNCQVFGVPDK